MNRPFKKNAFIATRLYNFYLYRRGEGSFKKREKSPDLVCSNDPLGQKYEFRETDLRLNRKRGNGAPKPFLTVSNSGIYVFLLFIFADLYFLI